MTAALHTQVQVKPESQPGAEVVLLCSGLGGSAGYWGAQLPALLEAGYRVITYDQRGTGRSRQPLPADYRIEHMVEDVLEILRTEDVSRCHFVGHALGGLVGLQLALDQPGRLISLSLVNAWAAPNPHSARCFDARLALLDHAGPRAYVEAQPIFLYPASWAAAQAQRVQKEVEHALEHFPGADIMKARIGALRRFDVSERLAEINLPVWVSSALDDVLVPATCSERLAQAIAGSLLHVQPHGGHAHNVTAPEAFNEALLGFLTRQSQS
ncbi:pyrimidine utilization protein D [Pseudomonas sp. DC3000-4b1]|uniref:pyrimidine utilization protein D n=1 Tax=unclassified Pseudomonas TaxID=196821 RepID=UPI003CF6E695